MHNLCSVRPTNSVHFSTVDRNHYRACVLSLASRPGPTVGEGVLVHPVAHALPATPSAKSLTPPRPRGAHDADDAPAEGPRGIDVISEDAESGNVAEWVDVPPGEDPLPDAPRPPPESLLAFFRPPEPFNLRAVSSAEVDGGVSGAGVEAMATVPEDIHSEMGDEAGRASPPFGVGGLLQRIKQGAASFVARVREHRDAGRMRGPLRTVREEQLRATCGAVTLITHALLYM